MSEYSARDMALALLLAIYQGIDADFRQQYRLKLRSMFEERIRLHARMTDDVRVFVDKLCRSMSAEIIVTDDNRALIETALLDHHPALMQVLRTETSALLALLIIERNRKFENLEAQ
jgi:hypothetical protein